VKYRQGFVSNSSSSSFVVAIDDLSPLQVWLIENHIEIAQRAGGFDCADDDNAWSISKDGSPGKLCGDTYMDNFDMKGFMVSIGVDVQRRIEWRGDNY